METTLGTVVEKCQSGAWKAYTRGESIYLTDGQTIGVLYAPDMSVMHGDRERFGENESKNLGPYKGFMIIECENCGAVKGFCAKQPTYSYKCNDCGEETPLEELRPMYMRCKCGKDYRYLTNLKTNMFTKDCISCGAPVDMELNGRKTAYVTIGERSRKR